jgi:soluble lytic murein transglycosylase
MLNGFIQRHVKYAGYLHLVLCLFVSVMITSIPFESVSFADGKPPVPRSKPSFLQDDFKQYLVRLSEAVPVTTGRMAKDQIELYKQIFLLQEEENIGAANERIRQLTDPRLLGHVLYQRYMQDGYIATVEELRDWLAVYGDQPGAQDIYKLAMRKGAAKYGIELTKPTHQNHSYGAQTIRADFRETYISSRNRTSAQKREVASLQRKVHAYVRQGRPTQGLKVLNSRKTILDKTEYNNLRSRVAAGYLYTGDVQKAYSLASAAAKESGENAPLSGWVAGLASWRLQKYEDAARYFEMAAQSPYANGWTISGSAFWASRAHMRTQNFQKVSYWLNRATEFPRTFYGLIALRAMNRSLELNLQIPAYERNGEKVLGRHAAGVRAFALHEVGQDQLAERELTSISLSENADLKPILLGYAMESRMASLSWTLGNAFRDTNGNEYDAALYPLMPWEPTGGFTVDRALIHALARQESRFEPSAGNASGASGLLQLMPATAKEVAGNLSDVDFDNAAVLKNPVTNISIGQEYIHYLFKHYSEDQDLFSLMIAWNAGPGNLMKWQKRLDDVDDPLLFIESIPAYETRAFVERVMTNFWIYRIRLGEELTSLEDVASGRRPRYIAQEFPQPGSDLRVAKN